MGEPAEHAIDAAWADLDADLRRDACVLLSRTNGAQGRSRLLGLLDDADGELRTASARALGARRCVEALPALVRRLETAALEEDDLEAEEELEALVDALVTLARPDGAAGDAVTGEISYTYRERDTPYPMPATERFGLVAGADIEQVMSQTHEVNATIAAEVPTVRTFFEATYNWRHGLPVVRDGDLRTDFGRFDLRVRQPLPFRAMRTEWSAMLQVRNLLGPEYDGLYNVSLAELVGLTRGIAGGLAVRF